MPKVTVWNQFEALVWNKMSFLINITLKYLVFCPKNIPELQNIAKIRNSHMNIVFVNHIVSMTFLLFSTKLRNIIYLWLSCVNKGMNTILYTLLNWIWICRIQMQSLNFTTICHWPFYPADARYCRKKREMVIPRNIVIVQLFHCYHTYISYVRMFLP